MFFLLRIGGVNIRDQITSTLEVESGTNDPMAIFLTVTLVELVAGGHGVSNLDWHVLVSFFEEMGIGVISGLAGGWIIVTVANRSCRTRAGPDPRAGSVAAGVFRHGAIGGSGFLAVYVAGLFAGNRESRRSSPSSASRRHDLARPDHHVRDARPARHALGIPHHRAAGGAARPVPDPVRPADRRLALHAALRFQPERNHLRGMGGPARAVSILLSILPIINGLENGQAFFNITFIIVLVSLIVQGGRSSRLRSVSA